MPRWFSSFARQFSSDRLGCLAASDGVKCRELEPRLSSADLRVSRPALCAKQRAIADYLDAETARIDALIERSGG